MSTNLDQIHRDIGSLNAKADILLERTQGFDKRLSAVERKVWWASGVVGVLAFALAHLPFSVLFK